MALTERARNALRLLGMPRSEANALADEVDKVEDISSSEFDFFDGAVAGTPAAGKALIAGESDNATAVLDFSSMTLASGARVLRGSALDFEAVTGWMAFSGNTTTGFRYATYFQPTTDGDAYLLGHGIFPQIIDGGSSDRMQALSSVMTVESGGTLASRGGDAVAGAHNVWAKFGANLSNCTIASGARIAPIWSDIQVNNGDVSGEEVFHFFATAGGSRARALIRNEGHSKYFLETDGDLDDQMAVSSGYDTTQNNDPAGYLKVNLNGTIYGIPLMSAS